MKTRKKRSTKASSTSPTSADKPLTLSRLARLAALNNQEIRNVAVGRKKISPRAAFQIFLATGHRDDPLPDLRGLLTIAKKPGEETWADQCIQRRANISNLRDLVVQLIHHTIRQGSSKTEEPAILEAQLWFSLICSLVDFRVRVGLKIPGSDSRWVTGRARSGTVFKPTWVGSFQAAVLGKEKNIHKDDPTRWALGMGNWSKELTQFSNFVSESAESKLLGRGK